MHVFGQLGCRRVAPVRFRLHRFANDRFEVPREQRFEPVDFEAPQTRHLYGSPSRRPQPSAHSWGFLVAQGGEKRRESTLAQHLRLERQDPGEQLVEDDPEGVDIAPRIDGALGPSGLFRAHVVGGTDPLPFCGEQRLLVRAESDRLGDAEIDDLRYLLPVFDRHQDVAGLQVAVDDPFLVRMLNPAADGDEQLQPFFQAERMGVAVAAERRTFDVFHRDVGAARTALAGIEHPGDVRVAHQGQRLALGRKAGGHLQTARTGADQLERHGATDRVLLLGKEHLPHAPRAEPTEQAVRTDRLPKVHGIGALVSGKAALLSGRFDAQTLGEVGRPGEPPRWDSRQPTHRVENSSEGSTELR